MLCQIGIALSYAVWAVSHNFTVFVVARVIGGISKGNVSLSFAIISDITPPNKRAKGMVSDLHCIDETCILRVIEETDLLVQQPGYSYLQSP